LKANFGSNTTKGPKQESKNRLRSPMTEGGETEAQSIPLIHKLSNICNRINKR